MNLIGQPTAQYKRKKKSVKDFFFIVRKGRDSNPRYAKRTTVFETAPIDHSGTFPV